jgi:hypothetical protein
MNFSKQWTKFALDAEVEHFGTARICKAHNEEVARLKEALEKYRGQINQYGEHSSVDDLVSNAVLSGNPPRTEL